MKQVERFYEMRVEKMTHSHSTSEPNRLTETRMHGAA